MSLEAINIGHQLTTSGRRLESSVNTSLRTTSAALQTTDKTAQTNNSGKTEEKIHKIVEQVQNISNMFDRKLQFRISEELDQVVVKVIDSNTDKVIREIPSAEIQKLQIRIKEALGLLFDESI